MAITVQMRTQVTQLYVALFGRAPDAEGLGYWVQRVNAGESLTSIANAMFATEPARAYYPSFLTNQEIIASFYVNVLGRTADAEGLAHWTAKLNAPGATPGSVINEMIGVVANYVANGGSDPAGLSSAALYANKVQVAQYWGENVGTIAGADAILSTITADPASVTAAITAINTPVPINYNLTTGVDVVDASGANTVTGTADVAGTFTTGDIVKGNGSTTLNLTVNGTPPSLATVANVGNVNVNVVASSTVNADLWSGINTVSIVSPTLNGTTLTLQNAQVGTVYGISGTNGSMTVTYRDTSGTADNALGYLAGAGTTANPVTLDLSSANTVEGLVLSTTGSNTATVNAGTGAKTVTVGGNGTNTLTFGATAATVAFDASTSTGTNKFTFASGSIGKEDTVKGGTGADTVTANASTSFAKMTGVETFVTTVNGGVALYDGANVTGLKTVTINQGTAAGSELFSNMKSEFTTLNVNGPTGTQEVGYVTGADATLAVNYGPGSTAFDTTFDGLSVSNVKDLTVTLNVGGVAPVAMGSGSVTLDKVDTTSLALVQAGSDDSVYLSVERADALDSLAITASGDNSTLDVSIDFASQQATQGLEKLTITASGVSSSATLDAWDYVWNGTAYDNKMALTELTLTASGQSSEVNVSTNILTVGDLSAFTITASGDSSSVHIDQTLSVTGNIGTIDIIASGNDSDAEWHSYISVYSGDIGTINVVASGNTSSASIDDINVYTGSIGAINVTASGSSSDAEINALEVSGDVGAISITASGASSDATLSADTIYGSITSVSVLASGANSTASFSVSQSVTGDIGSISVIATGNMASADAYVSWVSGDVGPVTVTASGQSSSASLTQYVGGNVGAVAVTASGADSYGYFDEYASGNVQSLTVTASGADSSAFAYLYDYDGSMTVGAASVLATGDSAFAYAEIDTGSAGVLGTVTVQATKANSTATLDFVGNTFGSIAVTTGSPSSEVNLYVENLTTSGGTITSTGAGELYLDIQEKSIASLSASGQTNKVTVVVDGVNATAGMTLTTGSFADNVMGGKGVDTFSLGGGADVFNFSNLAAGATDLSAVTDVIAGGFASGTDKLLFNSAGGSSVNYVEVLTPAASEAAFAAAANSALTGTVKYYFGVVGTDGYLAYDADGTGTTSIIKLTGITDMAATDISANPASAVTILITPTTPDGNSTADGTVTAGTVTQTVAAGAFSSGFDKLDGPAAGSLTNYAENLTAAASLAAFSAAAEAALNGTVQYYFGVVGGNGYLAYNLDGTGIDALVQLTGVLDMAPTDII